MVGVRELAAASYPIGEAANAPYRTEHRGITILMTLLNLKKKFAIDHEQCPKVARIARGEENDFLAIVNQLPEDLGKRLQRGQAPYAAS